MSKHRYLEKTGSRKRHKGDMGDGSGGSLEPLEVKS